MSTGISKWFIQNLLISSEFYTIWYMFITCSSASKYKEWLHSIMSKQIYLNTFNTLITVTGWLTAWDILKYVYENIHGFEYDILVPRG